MTSNSLYCESRWYLGLGRNALVSPFYTRDLQVATNRCRLTGSFTAICGYVRNPKSITKISFKFFSIFICLFLTCANHIYWIIVY